MHTCNFYTLRAKVKTVLFLLAFPLISLAQLSGVITVGTLGGENYSSLTNTGGLFQAINTLGVNGNLQVNITSDLTAELGTITLNQWSAPFTIKICPQSASLKTITYSGCSSALLKFNGTDNITLDGSFAGSGRYLRFVSSCNSYAVIELDLDCINVEFKNIEVASDNSSNFTNAGGAILIQDTQTGLGSDNFKFNNCLIEDLSGSPDLFYGIQFNAPANSTGVVTGLEIRNNHFNNINGKGIILGKDNGIINSSIIANNHFYATGNISGPGPSWYWAAVEIESGSGHNIRANYVGGQAAACNGGKMNFLFAGGSELFSPLRITPDVPNALFNTLDSNVIKNMSINGNSTTYINAAIIRIEKGNFNVGTVNGNIIGDINADASNVAGASIEYTENTESSNNNFRAIYTSSSGSGVIENNIIAGILTQASSTIGCSTYILYSNSSTTSFNNNRIGGLANSIVKKSDGDFRVIFANGTNAAFSIASNTISGIATSNNFNSTLYLIRASGGSGIPSITNNLIEGINVNNLATQPDVNAIRVDNPGASVVQNTVSSVSVLSSLANTQFVGIDINRNSSTFNIQDNRIINVSLTNSATIDANSRGIVTNGTSSFTMDANFIKGFSIASADNNSYIRGINVNTSTQNTLLNNVVLLDNPLNTNDIYLYGIYDNSSGGTNRLWHNTIDIRGSSISGSRRSACYYRTGSCTRNIQNNIFNNRRLGGTGGHYTMYHNTTGGAMSCNYNLLYAEENVGKLVFYTTNRTFVSWKSLGFDLNSVNPLGPQNLVDFATGYQTTIAGNDVGNASLGINVDFSNTTRSLDAGFDMGAFELYNVGLSSPLPIELLSLEANAESDRIRLTWQTASEKNNDYFTVERSIDAVNFDSIIAVDAAGNSNKILTYHAFDVKPQKGISYYRLKQTDFGGNYSYSHIVAVNQNLDGSELRVFPNPSQNEVFLTFNSDENCVKELSIFNEAGLKVASINENFVSGNNVIKLPADVLTSGLYILVVKGNPKTVKFVRQ